VEFRTPFQAQANGVATLYQEIQVIPDLSVAENLYGRHGAAESRYLLQLARLFTNAQEQIDALGLKIDATQNERPLSTVSRKMIEIITGGSQASSIRGDHG
jgi:ribose transport system ATP-binding protein